MAITKQSALSRPPYRSPISKDGFISSEWIQYFDAIYRRIGGANSVSNNDLNDANSANASDLASLKQSVVTLEENQNKLSDKVSTNSSDISTLQANQKQDHESIVTTAERLTNLQNSLNNLSDEVATINDNIDNINIGIQNINNQLYKAKSVSALPDASANAFTLAAYNGGLYFSDGSLWKQVTLT